MTTEEKRVVIPRINVKHNEDDTGLYIDIDLAGAKKETVDLEFGDGGFCVKGEGENFRYESCYVVSHDVNATEAEAKLDSGLLQVSVPFKESLRGHKVYIEK